MCWVRQRDLGTGAHESCTSTAISRWSCRPISRTSSRRRKQKPIRAQSLPPNSSRRARACSISSEGTALQRLLPNGCNYSGIDRAGKKRAASTCDLNAGEFPTEAASKCDVIVMLGVLERIADVENLFTHLRFCKRDIILSYCATDLAKDADRARCGFVNHLSFYDLARLFDRYGFRIECTTPIDETQVLMRLTPSEWLSRRSRHAALR